MQVARHDPVLIGQAHLHQACTPLCFTLRSPNQPPLIKYKSGQVVISIFPQALFLLATRTSASQIESSCQIPHLSRPSLFLHPCST